MSDRKARIKKSMMDHLKSKGYPNLTSAQILAELKPMWDKLGQEGLLQPGWNYGSFVQIAHAQAHYQNLREAMEEELLRHFAKRPR